MSGDEAWGKLPPLKKPLLPEWARILSGPLPKTTAKMLELDYFHREKNPLGPVFAAQIRRTVAGALGSKFGVATAEADLKQAGPLPPPTVAEKVALAFAKKLTEEGHAITDKEFAELLLHWDPAEVTAIVHTVAYANFHNRIVLAIGANGDPVPPVAVAFDDTAKSNAPARPPWDDLKSVSASGLTVRVEWGKDGFDELNASLAKQQERKLRIALPDAALIRETPAARARFGQEDPLEHGQCRLSARDDAGLVRVPLRILRGGEGRSRLHQLRVLGRHADQRLLLLNGPQRNVARGRGPQAGRSEGADEETGDRGLVDRSRRLSDRRSGWPTR